VKGKNKFNEILKVYCHRLSHSAFVLLRNQHEEYNSFLSPMGSLLQNKETIDSFKLISEKCMLILNVNNFSFSNIGDNQNVF
jgi:hypothetical protein